jgi:hypothetical protein
MYRRKQYPELSPSEIPAAGQSTQGRALHNRLFVNHPVWDPECDIKLQESNNTLLMREILENTELLNQFLKVRKLVFKGVVGLTANKSFRTTFTLRIGIDHIAMLTMRLFHHLPLHYDADNVLSTGRCGHCD